MKRLAVAVALALGSLSSVNAAVAYDEAVSGDLSNNRFAPTFVALQQGSNLLVGTTGNVAGVFDRDYFRISLPTGSTLSALTLLNASVPFNLSFIAVQAGTEVTVDPTAGSPAGLLGYTHFGPQNIGQNLLPAMGTAAGATDFIPPLGAGDYSFWIQETQQPSVNYSFDLTVSAPIPEPASLALLAFGLAAFGASRRLRGRRAD